MSKTIRCENCQKEIVFTDLRQKWARCSCGAEVHIKPNGSGRIKTIVFNFKNCHTRKCVI